MPTLPVIDASNVRAKPASDSPINLMRNVERMSVSGEGPKKDETNALRMYRH